MKHNRLLMVDSYKHSHYLQLPPGTEFMVSYIESRGGIYDKTVFFGLQAFLKEYYSTPITAEEVEEAKYIVEAHGEPFNYEGWMYIVNALGGKLPICIMAVPEGAVVPISTPLVSVFNTDAKVPWLTSFVETALLRAVWYPTTVATVSWNIRQTILANLEQTGDSSLIDFKLHDFGARGVSSAESAALGGMGHLVSFKGTDTMEAIVAARRYYNEPMAGFSIPASEHSTITSWMREGEVDAYKNMVNMFSGEGKIYACVSDSYNIFAAVDEIWGDTLKDLVKNSGGTLVVRPDSGDPKTVVLEVLHSLWASFGGTINDKGYKVLHPSVRVIQGDGVNPQSIKEILDQMEFEMFSGDNITFGMGGALLQKVDRDTMKWAMKASAAYVNGEWRHVFKDPVTDHGKKSKRGMLTLTESNGKIFITDTMLFSDGDYKDLATTGNAILSIAFLNGRVDTYLTFDEVRENAKNLIYR